MSARRFETSRRREVRPRETAQTAPIRPPSPATTCTRCGGAYVDDDPGREAHRVVFGHGPAATTGR